MKERKCKNCIHKKEKGCELWACNYKPNTYEQGYKDGYKQALTEALERLRKVTGE